MNDWRRRKARRWFRLYRHIIIDWVLNIILAAVAAGLVAEIIFLAGRRV